MRKSLIDRVATYADEEPELPAPHPLVEASGPAAAAWLVRAHRRNFHATGAVDLVVVLHAKTEIPVWFLVAVDFLRRRPGWAVDVSQHRQRRTYRVRWLAWRHRVRRGSLS